MFKNLYILRLTTDISGTGERLNDRPARDPGALESSTTGWGKVCPKSEMLIHQLDNCSIVCHEKREKLLPSQVVKDEVAERAEKIEQDEGRRLRRSEKDKIKEQVLLEMLPKAFRRNQRTMALIDHTNNLLIVDTPSPKRVDDVVALLADTIGGLPRLIIKVKDYPGDVMTRMFQSHPDDDIWSVGADTVLMDPSSEVGAIRIKSLDQTQDEIRSHLEAGRKVQELELRYGDRINMVLTDKLIIKSVKYLDLVQDAREEIQAESEQEQFDADMHIMIAEMRSLVPAVFDLFGGETGMAANENTGD
jgi:recombination associated protein RdgC